MAAFTLQHLSFQYAGSTVPVLNDISMEIPSGKITLICGCSGSGKSTLLRRMKSILADHGRQSGKVLLDGIPLEQISEAEQAQRIAFVQQHPDDQIVTDRVFHELAFGLENLGMEQQKMRLRIAETASFFGLTDCFLQDVASLSGGQKQLLNLAAAVAMDPEILILDEPTSQLDPIAASQLLAMIQKLNVELGTTVVFCEQRLEEALPMADWLGVLEEGNLIAQGEPGKVVAQIQKKQISDSFPTSVRLFQAAGGKGSAPLTVREGRDWLKSCILKTMEREKKKHLIERKKPFIELKDCHFRYQKEGSEVLDGISLALYPGEIYALTGANGSGKSTTLRLLCGSCRPYLGNIRINGRIVKKVQPMLYGIAALPQDPRCLLVGETVEEDLREMQADPQEEQALIELLELKELLQHHPYDLSGGEQQRLALGKVLLTKPSLLLLDEPTKGMDAHLKKKFGALLNELKGQGIAVLLVSHDIEFCAAYADRCGLLFRGKIVSEGETHDFFADNRFYTTMAARMSRGILRDVVCGEEILQCIQR